MFTPHKFGYAAWQIRTTSFYLTCTSHYFDRSITLLITVYDFTRFIHEYRHESPWHLSAFYLDVRMA
jgi:hypothetical protein